MRQYMIVDDGHASANTLVTRLLTWAPAASRGLTDATSAHNKAMEARLEGFAELRRLPLLLSNFAGNVKGRSAVRVNTFKI